MASPPKTCPVCRGAQKLALPHHNDMDITRGPTSINEEARVSFETYPCPRCIPTVPYRRVRATKLVADFDTVEFANFQMPLQRQLAAEFGQYLLREGLLWFTTDNVDDRPGNWRETVRVAARCNVVDRTGGEVSGAESRVEVAYVDGIAPPQRVLNQIEQRRRRLGLDTAFYPESVFKPEAEAVRPPPKGRERIRANRERAEAMADRFSGLELDADD